MPTLANTDPHLFAINSSPDPFNVTINQRQDKGSDIVALLRDTQMQINSTTQKAEISNFTTLDQEKCIKEYAVSFLQGYSDILVVSTVRNTTDPLLWTRFPQRYIAEHLLNRDPFHWMCRDIPKSESFDPNNVSRQPTASSGSLVISLTLTGPLH
jgi:hypothetical protein